MAVLWEVLAVFFPAYSFFQLLLEHKLLPAHYFKYLMSIKFWIFMEVTVDYSSQDFRSPFPVPRSPFNILVTSREK